MISATEIDKLTGLYNRDYFFQYADEIFREHPSGAWDAIVINIEQFHLVNALKGVGFGDAVLRALGDEINAIAKERDGIGGRFGADRFDLYCRHADDYYSLYDRLNHNINDFAQGVGIGIRVGVMPWQADLAPIQQFDRARTACNMARGHYREPLIVFDEKVRERELLERRLTSDVRRALDNYEFEVYYQPIYDIRGIEPVLVGAEALVRWQHPELGMLFPDSFIPLFERHAVINEVDKYVWAQAARQIARWRDEFGVVIPVSVNLSRLDVFDPTLIGSLEDTIVHNGLERSMLRLEITESAYVENVEQVPAIAEKLRSLGYMVEMDDFGTGYSSLYMLSVMPVDVLKLDKKFVNNIDSDEKNIQMVRSILDVAKTLNVPVVAEGVEEETQLRLLKMMGCTAVQGYYFSRPLHPSEFKAKLLANKTNGNA